MVLHLTMAACAQTLIMKLLLIISAHHCLEGSEVKWSNDLEKLGKFDLKFPIYYCQSRCEGAAGVNLKLLS